MTLLAYSNADSKFTNVTADADGAEVLTRWNDIKTFLNGSSLDTTNNIAAGGVFAWTNFHSWTVNNTTNHNRSLTVSGVMAVSTYGDQIISSAAQINAPLLYRALSNASSTQSVEEIVNAGTGDSHKVTNSNTGACYSAVTTSTGHPFKANVRSLANLSAPLVSKTITTPVSVTNDATETVITGATVTLPANYLVAGSTIKGSFYGTIASPGAGPATVYFKVKLGGIAGTVLLDSGVLTPSVSLVGSLLKIDYILTCITTGAVGTIEAQGIMSWNSNTIPVNRGLGIAASGNANTAPIVIDTTTQKDLILEFKMGSAVVGSTIAIRNGIVEIKR